MLFNSLPNISIHCPSISLRGDPMLTYNENENIFCIINVIYNTIYTYTFTYIIGLCLGRMICISDVTVKIHPMCTLNVYVIWNRCYPVASTAAKPVFETTDWSDVVHAKQYERPKNSGWCLQVSLVPCHLLWRQMAKSPCGRIWRQGTSLLSS